MVQNSRGIVLDMKYFTVSKKKKKTYESWNGSWDVNHIRLEWELVWELGDRNWEHASYSLFFYNLVHVNNFFKVMASQNRTFIGYVWYVCVFQNKHNLIACIMLHVCKYFQGWLLGIGCPIDMIFSEKAISPVLSIP